MERGATSPCSKLDHDESTHYECDIVRKEIVLIWLIRFTGSG